MGYRKNQRKLCIECLVLCLLRDGYFVNSSFNVLGYLGGNIEGFVCFWEDGDLCSRGDCQYFGGIVQSGFDGVRGFSQFGFGVRFGVYSRFRFRIDQLRFVQVFYVVRFFFFYLKYGDGGVYVEVGLGCVLNEISCVRDQYRFGIQQVF